jgi:lipoprotein-releasing system ATP-binding protein
MSDDLERILKRSKAAGHGNPRLQVGPRVQGGPLLDGAPKLDTLHPAEEPPASNGKTYAIDGPHLASRPKDGRAPAEFRPRIQRDVDAAKMTGHQLIAVNLKKSYRKGSIEIPVLKGVHLSVRRGEFLAIVGQSGSGKSTLLHLLGTLDAPSEGEIYFEGGRVDNLPARPRDLLRNQQFGMIFQFYHLLPEFNTLENVLAPLMIGQGVLGYFLKRAQHKAAAQRLLEMVGLGHRLRHKPRELSGGEMQRAAIARALVAGPKVLLADEPTGNLDRETGREILEILRSLNQQENLTIVMVTHDQAIAERTDRVIRLVDGRVEDA